MERCEGGGVVGGRVTGGGYAMPWRCVLPPKYLSEASCRIRESEFNWQFSNLIFEQK